MKRRFISLILCLCMIFSLFAGYQTAFASEERGEYIVYLDVESHSPGYVKEYENRNYEEAIKLADEALDYYQEKILEKAPEVEVLSRLELLLPSLCVKASKDELNIIKSLDFVKDVYVNEELREADVVRSDMAVFQDKSVLSDSIKMIGSNELIDNDDVLQEKYNGAGSVLAIIDSNMDPSHEAFYLSPETQTKLSKLKVHEFLRNGSLKVKDHGDKEALVKSLYRSEKIPFGWNYMVNTDNLNPENEVEAHGQHVSGTVGGNKVRIGNKTWRGVAPESQLLMMNVMRKGSTSSNVYMHAMQDAITMGADAVNMSLGSTKGLPNGVPKYISDAINNGYAADTNFVIAAGNEGDYQGKLNIENPDFGTMASPGIATNAITVASLENKIMYGQVLDYEGMQLPFRKAGKIFFEKGDYEFVDCGLGKPEDFEGKDVAGKVALIKRGGLTFTDKIKNAEAVKAKGVIIYNNVEGELGLAIDGTKIPAIAVGLKVGEKLLNGKSKTVHIDMTPREMINPEYGELSSFTNWGLAAGGYMKPDITAPGGHIYSTQTKGNTFGDMSGTSMATPHVTGGVGVLRKRLNELMFADVKNKAALTKTILMNSAVPHMDPVTGFTTSPRRQGAGIMNLTKASKLDFTVVDKDTKIASKFVGNVNDEITLNLTITNYSAEPKTLTPFVQATIEAREGKTLSLRPDKLFDKNFDYKIEVPGQGTKDVTITFPIENADKFADFVNGAFVEGFLHLSDQNGMEVSFPFVSFKGDFGKIPSIEKPLYDFTFENGDEPMYWSYKFTKNDWFKYSTHFETIQGSEVGADGKKYNNIVIAGLKNFAEIDANKNTAKEPKPEFGTVVISPNGDNYNDALGLNLVMTRSADVKATVINEAGEEKEYPLGLQLTNISFIPDDNSRKTYLGYTSPGTIPVKDLKDGNYTLKLSAEAVKGVNENYPATFREMKFMIDKTAPDFKNAFYDETTRTLTFNLVEEGSGIDEFKIEDSEGNPINFTKEDGKVTLLVPEGKELSDINITARDLGYNTNAVTAEMLVFKDMFGSLKVEVKQTGREPLNLEYKVVDEAGKEVKNHENLKFGKYKLIVTDYSNKFELKGESEIPFEISEGNKEHKIVLEFTEIPTGRVTIKVASKDNLEWTDFDLYAKNVKNEKEFKFIQDEGMFEYYFDADLPYGDYNFYAKYKEGKAGYSITFDKDMPFTVNSSTSYSTITANIKRSGYYKVHVTTEGTSENVKYLAKDNKNGSIVGLDELSEGTWMIFPEKMPEGMYLEKPYEYVTLTQEKPEANVRFSYQEIADNKFKFTIKDNYDNAKYYICDFYGWVSNGKKGTEYTYEKGGIDLTPGFYYVEAVADKVKFGETTITVDNQDYVQDSRTFKSVTEPVEVEFKWTSYAATDKESEGMIFVIDDALPLDQQKDSYEYVLTGTKGAPITKTFVKSLSGIDSILVDLPYDYYKVEMKGLPEGYTIKVKEFVVDSKEFQVMLTIVPEEAPAEKVKVNVNFMKGEEEVQDVTYKLGDEEFNKNSIEIAPGTYDVAIVSPEGLVPAADSRSVTIDKDTKNLTINLEDKKPTPTGNGTIKFEVYETDGTNETKSDMDITAWVGAKMLNNGKPMSFPYGTYDVELSDYDLDENKYDLENSELVKTVTIDDTNQDVVVKFVLKLKSNTPEPTGKGTIKVEVYEFSDAGAKLEQSAYVYLNGKFNNTRNPIEVSYGTHTVELSSYTWNMDHKYDETKSIIKKIVKVDENNPNVTVKLYKVIKGTAANPPVDTDPTPGPEPTGKGKASWDIDYNGSNANARLFSKAKLYKVTATGDVEIPLGYKNRANDVIELEFGKYAYVLEDYSDFMKLDIKNKRIEFTLDNDNQTFKAVFEVEDKKETQQVEVKIPKNANESLNYYTIRVFDMKGNEVEGVTKTAKGFEFPAVSGADYELRLEGTKYAYYPNIINAYPSPTFSKTITITSPLILKVNSLAGEATIKAKYAVYTIYNRDKIYVTDLKKVPYIASGNQLYQVKFLSCEQGYKLKDEEVKEFTVTDYQKYELTFNFERDESQEIVNTEALEALIKEYAELKETDDYKNADPAKRSAYDDAIAEAKAELEKEKTTQTAIDNLAEKVRQARDAIVGSMVKLRKEELKKLLNEADANKAKDTYIYDTPEDKKAYDDAIDKGQKVYDDQNATEQEVMDAIRDIENAKNNLDGYNEANKEALQKLIDAYENVRKTKKYMNATSKEKDDYDNTIVDGYNVLHKQKATQDEVDKAVQDIKDAYAKLSGIEEPTEKTNAATVEDAIVNDRFVNGTGVVGATVYYRVGESGELRTGMKIMEDGKFSLDLGQIHANDKIYVYQQEVNKLMSDPVIVKILPLDKTELIELIKKAEEIKKTDKFKYAPKDRQKDLEDELAKAIKLRDDENSSKEDIDRAIVNLKSAIAMIENFEIVRYDVKFYPNNETESWVLKIIEGEKVTKPENDPIRKGYKFLGWFADEELTKEFDFDKAIEANTNVYAKWEEIIHLVTFDPNNGEATWVERVREGEKVNKPADPIKANHTFIAWQFNGEDYNFDTSVMSNIMLIAKWEENRVEPTPIPTPTPTPEPYEPYEPYKPEPKPHRPYRPITPRPETKPEEKREEKPVEPSPIEEKKDYGIITEYPINPVELKDIPAGDAGEAIRNLVSYGIIKGMGNGKFEGGLTINRAMVTRVFMLICKDKTITNDVYFKDVKDTSWYAETVKWAASKGIIAGYTDGTFKAEKKVSRQEFCVMLMNLLKAHGIELNAVVPVNEADFANVAAWSKDAMIAMKRAGLVNVDPSGKFGPESEFTRAELAKTIDLLIKLVKLK